MDSKRRAVLQVLAGGAVSGVVLTGISLARPDSLQRPPGALHEADFLARCARCMRCFDACQAGALTIAHPGSGMANVGTPVLDINKCILCMECVNACPSGALSKIPKQEGHLGLAVIDQQKCRAWNKKKCQDCYRACRQAKAIKLDGKKQPTIEEEKCNGCGACVRRCPEEGAIFVDGSKARRYDPQPGARISKLDDRTDQSGEPVFLDWLDKRLHALAKHYGVDMK